MTIKLNQPVKPNLEKLTRYLTQVNDRGWYTNFGPLYQQLTKRLEEYLEVENLLLVSNGTLALQVAYKTLNVKSALTTPFSFVATSSSLLWQEIETSFSDIDRDTYNLCPLQAQKALDNDSSIDTIVATHVYGNPCNVEEFDKLAVNKKVKVIYDAAHAFGANVDGQSVLNFGDASTLSFHATKIFHTVEGGAIIFKRKADFERAKRLINFGLDDEGNITEVGINAKLNEYQCAVGLTILSEIDDIIEHREALFKTYVKELSTILQLQAWQPGTNYNGAYAPILFDNEEQLIVIKQYLDSRGIESRKYFTPSLDTIFKTETGNNSLVVSQNIATRILCLPLHFYMSQTDVIKVCAVIKQALINITIE